LPWSGAMRVKRNKTFRRILRFFRLEFGINDPYKVLVDGTFLTVALQQRIQVREQLPKMLSARATPMVTSCVLHELRGLGKRGQGAAYIAQGFYRVKCGHTNFLCASDCIKEQIGENNPRKLLVATQDIELGKALRQIPGVPLIRLNNSVPFVEDPSSASKDHREETQKRKLAPAAWEKAKLPALQQKEAAAAAAASTPRKRKGPKGANPLSCKKKKKKPTPPAGERQQAAEPSEADARPKRVRSRRMGGTVKRLDAEAGSAPKVAAAAPQHNEPSEEAEEGLAAAATSEALQRKRSRRRPATK